MIHPQGTAMPDDGDNAELRPSRVLDEAATVEACQADYKAGAPIRARIAEQEAQR